MGYLLKKSFTPWSTIFITSIVFALSSAASFYLGMMAMGVDIAKSYDQLFLEFKNAYMEMANYMTGMGMNKNDISNIISNFEKSFETMKLIIPGAIWASGLMLSFINFKLTRIVLKRINYTLDDVKPFSQWKLPDKWIMIVGTVMLLTVLELSFIKLPQLHNLATNVFTIILLLFIVTGLSAAKYFLDKYMVSRTFKGIILFIAIFSFSNVLMIIGVIDALFDLRNRFPKTA